MKVYSFSDARQRFAEVLQQARHDGQVQIRRRDGQLFVVQPAQTVGSPLDVPAVDSGLTAAEIVHLVHDSRISTGDVAARRPAGRRSRATSRRKRRRLV